MLVGQRSTLELAGLLATASIYAAPAKYEPFGLGILEAAYSGCALVLSDLPSLRESWTGAAIFVAAGDDDEWCDALNTLASDGKRRIALSREARQRARLFEPSAMASHYLYEYRALAAKHTARREEVALS